MKFENVLSVVCAGLLLGVGFVIPALWWCGFLGLALFLNEILHASSWKMSALIAGVVGSVWYAIVLAPTFWGILPLDWFGIESVPLQIFAVASTWLLASAVFSIGAIAFGMAVHAWRSRGRDNALSFEGIIVIPVLWVISEWLGAWIESVLGAGPGSLIGAHFTIGSTGYLLANDSVLLQLASIGGMHLLSFIVAIIGVLLYIISSTIKAPRQMTYAAGGILIAGLCVWAVLHLIGFPRSDAGASAPRLSVAVVSRYVLPKLRPTPEEAEADFRSVYASVQSLKNLDVLVFPEDTAFLRATPDGSHDVAIRSLQRLGKGSSTPLVIDSDDMRRYDGALLSRVSFWKGENDVTYGYKDMFMPFGEYIPYLYRAILTLGGGKGLLDTITDVRGYVPGGDGGMGIVNGAKIAVRFCDEALSPELFRNQVANGANVLVDISSQSWFHGSRLIYSQMQNVAKVRAVESGRWFVQSGNMSPAFVLDEHGHVVAETKWNVFEVMTAPVTPKNDMTLYEKYEKVGRWFIPFFVVLIVIIVGLRYLNEKRE